MARLTHRDMTSEERRRVERAASEESVVDAGWSSRSVAVLILLSGSFVAGLLLFGLPVTLLMGSTVGAGVRDALLFGPGLATLLVGGSWSVTYYVRGSWRVRRELLDDLEYGRVEVLRATVIDAWVIDASAGLRWLLDLGDEVLLLAASAAPNATTRTFPGRRLEVVRCKHSGLVLALAAGGPALAPTSRVRAVEVAPVESARYEGALEDVCQRAVLAAA